MAQRSEIDAQLADLADLADLAAGLPVNPTKDYGPNGSRVERRAELRRGVSGVAARLAEAFGLDHPFIVIDNPA